MSDKLETRQAIDADLGNRHPLRLMSASEAANVIGLSRNYIYDAMNTWTKTHGRAGLRFVMPNSRRMVSIQSLRDWYAQMEKRSACGF